MGAVSPGQYPAGGRAVRVAAVLAAVLLGLLAAAVLAAWARGADLPGHRWWWPAAVAAAVSVMILLVVVGARPRRRAEHAPLPVAGTTDVVPPAERPDLVTPAERFGPPGTVDAADGGGTEPAAPVEPVADWPAWIASDGAVDPPPGVGGAGWAARPEPTAPGAPGAQTAPEAPGEASVPVMAPGPVEPAGSVGPVEAALPGADGGPGGASGPELVGVVRGCGGMPLGGATLTVIDASGVQVGVAHAGEGGRFRVRAPGAGGYTLVVRAERHQPRAARITLEARDVLELEVVLAGTGGLAGVVRSAGREEPLAGATVTVIDEEGAVLATDVTDRRGRYAFRGLVGGGHTLAVHRDGHRPAAVPVAVPPSGTARQDVRLPGTARVAGVVNGAAGPDGARPVPGALVTLFDAGGARIAETVTDECGRYRLEDLSDGEYTIVASGYPAVTGAVRVGAGEAGERDLTLTHRPEPG